MAESTFVPLQKDFFLEIMALTEKKRNFGLQIFRSMKIWDRQVQSEGELPIYFHEKILSTQLRSHQNHPAISEVNTFPSMLRNSFRILVNFRGNFKKWHLFCLEHCSEVPFTKFVRNKWKEQNTYPRFFHRKIALQFSIAVASCLAGNSLFVNGLRYEFRIGPSKTSKIWRG